MAFATRNATEMGGNIDHFLCKKKIEKYKISGKWSQDAFCSTLDAGIATKNDRVTDSIKLQYFLAFLSEYYQRWEKKEAD